MEKHFNFAEALEYLRKGEKLQRDGWHGKGMYIHLQEPDENSKMTLPYLYLSTPGGNLIPWVTSQADVLAHDWKLFKDDEISNS